MSRSLLRLLLLFGATALGCENEPAPRELRLELPELITSKEPVLVHARAVQQDGTAREAGGRLEYRVTPPDLANVGKGGVFTCARSGDGMVALSVSGVEGRAKFSCKLAAKLEAPTKLSLDITSGEVDPTWKVLDASDRELDLPISVTSDRGNVVQARSGRVVPGSVGTATLTLRAGALTRKVDVEVVRTLKPEVLAIQDNRRISYSLPAGKYRLTLSLPSSQRVSVEWLGAPYCAYRGVGTEHRVDCTLQGGGSVSFDNPAFLLRGEKAPSVEGVTLREVP